MSFIPNVRKPGSYNEGNLNDHNKRELDGYDWCAEEVVDNFFDNLECLNSEYCEILLETSLPERFWNEYDMTFTFNDRKPETRKIETLADFIRYKMLECEWIEISRNELVVSMLEGQGDWIDEDEDHD